MTAETYQYVHLCARNGLTADDALDYVNRGDERVRSESTRRVGHQKTRDLDFERCDIGKKKKSG